MFTDASATREWLQQTCKPNGSMTSEWAVSFWRTVAWHVNEVNAFLFQVGTCSSHIRLWITDECGVDKSVNTSAVHVCAFYETRTLCKNAKCDAYNVFCGTVTISVATAGDFSQDLGFSCFIWVSGVFIENLVFLLLWSNFRNVSCITVFSIHEYNTFTGVMCRVSRVEQGKA